MRKLLSLIAGISLGVICLSFTLRVGIYDDYPLVFIEQGVPKGLYVSILNEIARKEGWKIEYEYMTWKELFSALASGKIDAIAAIAETKERKKVFSFNEEAFIQNWGVVVSRKPITSLFDLSEKRLGIIYNDVYCLKFLEILKSFNVVVDLEMYDSYEEEVRAMESNEIFAAVVSRLAAVALSQKHKFHISPLIFRPVELKIAFKKNSAAAKIAIPIIDKYLFEWKLKEDSVYWRAVNKFIVLGKTFPKWAEYLLWTLTFMLIIVLIMLSIQGYYSKKLRSDLDKATKELRDKNEELHTLNEELENSYRQLERTLSKTFEILEGVAQIANEHLSEEEFLQRILEIAIDVLEPAKYGSLFILQEDGQLRMMAAVGHDKDTFNSHKFKNTDFFILPDKPMIVENILDYDREKMDPEDFQVLKAISKPIKESLTVPIFFKGKAIGTMVTDIPPDQERTFSEFHVKIMENFTRIISVFLSYRDYIKLEGEFHKNIILILGKALDYYSPYTRGHSERVASISASIAEALGLPSKEIRKIYWAGILHDVGKIFVPQEIINKPDKLTDEEFELMKQHSVKSYELVKEIKGLEDIAKIVRHHHERWDGKGYPDGLKGEEAPLGARIIAVADAYDAMTSERPYRRALTPQEALEEIVKGSGTQFDPNIVNAFLKVYQTLTKSA